MYRVPDAVYRGPSRCTSGLKAGAATSNGGVIYEVVPVFGSSRLRVRIKVATNGGSLDVIPVGPDFDVTAAGVAAGSTAFASLVGTQYTTGGSLANAVTAGTEVKADLDLYGESYVILKYTGATGAGTITYADVSQL